MQAINDYRPQPKIDDWKAARRLFYVVLFVVTCIATVGGLEVLHRVNDGLLAWSAYLARH